MIMRKRLQLPGILSPSLVSSNIFGRQVGGDGLTMLIHDVFTTDRSAGSVDGTAAEPGPGTRDVIDTAGTGVSIVSSELTIAAGAASIGDPAIGWDLITRAEGVALYIEDFRPIDDVRLTMGWHSAVGGQASIRREATALRPFNSSLIIALWPATADYRIIQIMRSSGYYFLLKEGGDWKLLWINDTITGDQYPTISQYNSTDCTVEAVKVAQLGGNWSLANGIRVDNLAGSRSASDTFTHEADCIIRATIDTLPASGVIEFRLREQDASNYWRVTIDSTGVATLDEVVSSTPTNRLTTSAVFVNGEQLVIIADDETINIFDEQQRRGSYVSAVTFKTETSGQLASLGTGGAVSDIETWPRILSGGDLAQITALEAF